MSWFDIWFRAVQPIRRVEIQRKTCSIPLAESLFPLTFAVLSQSWGRGDPQEVYETWSASPGSIELNLSTSYKEEDANENW